LLLAVVGALLGESCQGSVKNHEKCCVTQFFTI
jgi:hypothetical protein